MRKRPLALLIAVISMAAWAFLTYAAVADKPAETGASRGLAGPRSERIKRPTEVGGLYVLQQRCFVCHSMTDSGRLSLQTLARNQFPAGMPWLEEHLQKQGVESNLENKEVDELMSGLRLVTGNRPDLLYTIPRQVRFGAHTFYNNYCVNCHTIDGQGGKKGPDLTIRPLRTKEWHIRHIREPQSVTPDSRMQEFPDFAENEYSALADYLIYLHTP